LGSLSSEILRFVRREVITNKMFYAATGCLRIPLFAELHDTDQHRACRLRGNRTRVFRQAYERLKSLGLTENVEVGDRLTPRGEPMLADLFDCR
jgi:hypothetical protein